MGVSYKEVMMKQHVLVLDEVGPIRVVEPKPLPSPRVEVGFAGGFYPRAVACVDPLSTELVWTRVMKGHPQRVPATRCGAPRWYREHRKLRQQFLVIKRVDLGLAPTRFRLRSAEGGVRREMRSLDCVSCPGCDFHKLHPRSEEGCANWITVGPPRSAYQVRKGFVPPLRVLNQVSLVDSTEHVVRGVNLVPVSEGSAFAHLEQVGEENATRAFRNDAQAPSVFGARLRRRQRWVNSLAGLLELSDRSLGRILSGRLSLGLASQGKTELVKSVGRLFEGGAKFLGAGTAQVRPLSADEAKEGVEPVETPLVWLWWNDRKVCFLPELVAYLSSRACFRTRDDTLVPSLKLKALEWCKDRFLTEVAVLQCMPFSVAMACSQSLPEQAATMALSGTGPGGKLGGEPKRGVAGSWFGGWGSTLFSGVPSGSWWKKGVS